MISSSPSAMLAPPIVTSVTTASSFLPSSSEISELTGLHGGESSAQKRQEGARRVQIKTH